MPRRDLTEDRPASRQPIGLALVGPDGRALRPIVSAAVRGLALVVIAMLLILVLLPAVLVAAAAASTA